MSFPSSLFPCRGTRPKMNGASPGGRPIGRPDPEGRIRPRMGPAPDSKETKGTPDYRGVIYHDSYDTYLSHSGQVNLYFFGQRGASGESCDESQSSTRWSLLEYGWCTKVARPVNKPNAPLSEGEALTVVVWDFPETPRQTAESTDSPCRHWTPPRPASRRCEAGRSAPGCSAGAGHAEGSASPAAAVCRPVYSPK